MLKPENRLKKVRDFNLIIKHGKWTSGNFLTIKYLRLEDNKEYFPKKEDPEVFKNQLKIAFVVGVKISKKAVVRNRLKRQIREVVRLLMKDKKIKSGYYVMIIAKKEIYPDKSGKAGPDSSREFNRVNKKYLEIEKEINQLLTRARILK